MASQNEIYHDVPTDSNHYKQQGVDADQPAISNDVFLAVINQTVTVTQHGRRQTMPHANRSPNEMRRKRSASCGDLISADMPANQDSGRGSLASSKESESRKGSRASSTIRDSFPYTVYRRQTTHHERLHHSPKVKYRRSASCGDLISAGSMRNQDSGRGSLASTNGSESRKGSHASAIKEYSMDARIPLPYTTRVQDLTANNVRPRRIDSSDSGVGQDGYLSSIPETPHIVDTDETAHDDMITPLSKPLESSQHSMMDKMQNKNNTNNSQGNTNKRLEQGRQMWIFRMLACCLCTNTTEETTTKQGTPNDTLQPSVNVSDSVCSSSANPDVLSMHSVPEYVNTADHHEPFEAIEALKRFQKHNCVSKETLTGYTLQMPNFAAAFLTERGGRIVIPNRPVNIFVPPGALPDGAVQLVYVYVKPGELPSLDDKETWLSPSVHCGPSGLNFKKDVFLTVPHSATEAQKWEFNTYQTKKSNGGTWKKLEDGQETLVVKHKAKCLILMNHFCGHRLSGNASYEDATKRVDVTVQVTGVDAESNTARINVFISNAEEVCLSV